MVNKAYHKFQ